MNMKFPLFLLLLSLAGSSAAQQTLRFEVLSGLVYNFPSPLIIHQDGYETIRIKAKYRSEPFDLPPYYDFRLTLWQRDSAAWGLKFTHHKLILDNPGGDIQHFEITHGYNIFSITRLWKRKGFIFNIAGGAVIANPQSNIRHLYFQGGGLFNNGYYLSGVVGEAAVGKQIRITRDLYLSGEIRFTAAWARVKVNQGHADVPNTAIHFLAGIGYSLASRQHNKWKVGGPVYSQE